MDRNRRVHQRYDLAVPVTLIVGDREVAAKSVNFSLGGICVATSEELPYGTQLKVRFRLPALKEEVTVDVTCRWQGADGIGMQFGSLRAAEVWALNQLFKKVSKS